MPEVTISATCKFFEGTEIKDATEDQFFGIVSFPDGSGFESMWEGEEAKGVRGILASDKSQEFVNQFMGFAMAEKLKELGLGKKVSVSCSDAIPDIKSGGTA